MIIKNSMNLPSNSFAYYLFTRVRGKNLKICINSSVESSAFLNNFLDFVQVSDQNESILSSLCCSLCGGKRKYNFFLIKTTICSIEFIFCELLASRLKRRTHQLHGGEIFKKLKKHFQILFFLQVACQYF